MISIFNIHGKNIGMQSKKCIMQNKNRLRKSLKRHENLSQPRPLRGRIFIAKKQRIIFAPDLEGVAYL
jgi:hypothetical protein